MSEKDLFKNYFDIVVAIDFCLSNKLIMPALILLYSAIDSISWIGNFGNLQTVRGRFELWVNTWMLQTYPLPCTATELYAARCGVLHTLTPYSELNEGNRVRKIIYAWGSTSKKDLAKSIKILGKSDYVAVHITEILFAFRNGLVDFMESVQTDDNLKALVNEKAAKLFTNLEPLILKEFITKMEKDNIGNVE